MVQVNIANDIDTLSFFDIEIGKLFVHSGMLFIKAGDDGDPVPAIEVKSGDVWNMDWNEAVQVPNSVDIEVGL